MNKRIKLLAEQANEAFYQRMGEGADRGTFYFNGFAEKFAELIVTECVAVVEGGSFLHDQAPTAQFARECSSAIKRHFGVEE